MHFHLFLSLPHTCEFAILYEGFDVLISPAHILIVAAKLDKQTFKKGICVLRTPETSEQGGLPDLFPLLMNLCNRSAMRLVGLQNI
jgi:hypothetical protein